MTTMTFIYDSLIVDAYLLVAFPNNLDDNNKIFALVWVSVLQRELNS
jgi:hypothetical protein